MVASNMQRHEHDILQFSKSPSSYTHPTHRVTGASRSSPSLVEQLFEHGRCRHCVKQLDCWSVTSSNCTTTYHHGGYDYSVQNSGQSGITRENIQSHQRAVDIYVTPINTLHDKIITYGPKNGPSRPQLPPKPRPKRR